MNFKKLLFILTLGIIAVQVYSFCGFYVAKADASLFNESSQVILVRDENKSIVTMWSDFKGDVEEFAMVVPVPTVLKKDEIKVVDASVFEHLDAYSAPRLAEYYDPNPCARYKMEERSMRNIKMMSMTADMEKVPNPTAPKVTIEAQYTIGEYDIMILSSTESTALKTWLNQNGYKVPAKAEEVLEPYIKSKLKFFVVKVNLEEQKKLGLAKLRPIQMTYQSNKFMLPIRLGMANANGAQDMIVYGFSKKGRMEISNYRTVKVPTDQNVPEFTRDTFGAFYKALFDNIYKQNKNSVFLEYAWNISGNNYVKCDPCSSTPPNYVDLKDAGIQWVQYGSGNNSAGYDGSVFFTRYHVRYDRANFPQDLEFQETPNQDNFQARYVMHIAVKDKLDCSEAKGYYKVVKYRREEELSNLNSLTGWHRYQFKNYLDEFANK